MAITAEQLRVEISESGAGDVAGGLDEMGASAIGAKEAIGGLGAGLAAASAGGIAASVGAFASFDEKMQESIAIMGDVSAAEREKLAQTAREVATTTTKSHEEAAESYYFLASAGLDAAESLKAMPEVAAFAEAGAMDMAQATDYATDVMQAFQIPVKNLSRVTDTMTAAVTRHNQTMDGMGTAMSYVAPVAKGLGMSIEETAASIGFLGDAGIKGSRAGTTLRQALSKLANPTKAMQKKLRELGVSVHDSEGNMRSFSSIMTDLKGAGATAADVMELFGTRAGPGMQVLLQQGGKAIAKEAKQLKSMKGVTQDVANTQKQTLNKQLDILKSKINDVAIATGKAFLPEMKAIVSVISGVVTWFSQLNNKTDGLAGKFTLLAGLVGGTTAALWAFVGGPITLIPAALAAIGMAVSGVQVNFRDLLSTADTLASQLIANLGRAFNRLKSEIIPRAQQAFERLAQRALTAFNLLERWLPPRIRKAVAMAVAWIRGEGATMAQQAFDWFIQQATAAFEFLDQRILPAVISGLNAIFTWITTTGASLAQQAFDLIFYNAEVAFNWLSTTGLQLAKDGLIAIWNWVKTTGASLATAALNLLWYNAKSAFGWLSTTGLQLAKDGLIAIWNWVKTSGVSLATQALTALWNGAVGAFDWLSTDGKRLVMTGLTSIWNWIKGPGLALARGAFNTLWEGAEKQWDWFTTDGLPIIKEGLRGVWRWLMGPATQGQLEAYTALWEGAKSAWDWIKTDGVNLVKEGIRAVWNWVKGPGVSFAKDALTVYWNRAKAGWDWFSTDGLAVIKEGLRGVWNWIKGPAAGAAKQALTTLWNGAKSAWDWLSTDGKRIVREGMRGVVNWIKNEGWDMFKSAYEGYGESIGKTISGIITAIHDVFKTGIPKIRNWLRNNGKNIIKNGWKAIGTGIRTLVLGMLAIGGIVGQAFVSTLTGLRDWLADGGATKLKNGFIDIITGIVDYLKNDAWGDLKGAAEFMFDGIMAAAEGLYDGLIGNSLIPDMMDDIADFIRNFDIVSAVSALASSAWKRFEKFTTDVLNVIKNGLGAVADWIRNDAAGDLTEAAIKAASDAAKGLKNAFNNSLPNKLSIPKVSVGGGRIAGQKVPKVSIGGQSLKIPKLDTGGFVQSSGLAMIHEGEQVVPAAQVTRNVNHAERGDGRQQVDVTLSVEGDDELTRIIRENASVVVKDARQRDNRHIKRNGATN